MKSWELTVYLVPHLRTVVDAVGRTQLNSYGIERNLKEIEEAFTSLLDKLEQVKERHERLY